MRKLGLCVHQLFLWLLFFFFSFPLIFFSLLQVRYKALQCSLSQAVSVFSSITCNFFSVVLALYITKIQSISMPFSLALWSREALKSEEYIILTRIITDIKVCSKLLVYNFCNGGKYVYQALCSSHIKNRVCVITIKKRCLDSLLKKECGITKVVLLGISVSGIRIKEKFDLLYGLLSVCEYLLSKTIDYALQFDNVFYQCTFVCAKTKVLRWKSWGTRRDSVTCEPKPA